MRAGKCLRASPVYPGGKPQLPFQPMPQGGSSLTTSFPCFQCLSRPCSLSRESLNMSISLCLCSTTCSLPCRDLFKNPGPASCRAGTNLLNEYAGNTRVWKSLQSLFNTTNRLPRSEKKGSRGRPEMRRGPEMRRPPPTQPAKSVAQAKFGNQRAVARGAFLAQVFQEPAALADHHQQTPARVQIVFVHFEMLG